MLKCLSTSGERGVGGRIFEYNKINLSRQSVKALTCKAAAVTDVRLETCMVVAAPANRFLHSELPAAAISGAVAALCSAASGDVLVRLPPRVLMGC